MLSKFISPLQILCSSSTLLLTGLDDIGLQRNMELEEMLWSQHIWHAVCWEFGPRFEEIWEQKAKSSQEYRGNLKMSIEAQIIKQVFCILTLNPTETDMENEWITL